MDTFTLVIRPDEDLYRLVGVPNGSLRMMIGTENIESIVYHCAMLYTKQSTYRGVLVITGNLSEHMDYLNAYNNGQSLPA